MDNPLITLGGLIFPPVLVQHLFFGNCSRELVNYVTGQQLQHVLSKNKVRLSNVATRHK